MRKRSRRAQSSSCQVKPPAEFFTCSSVIGRFCGAVLLSNNLCSLNIEAPPTRFEIDRGCGRACGTSSGDDRWSLSSESNRRPAVYETAAASAELERHVERAKGIEP